MTSSSASQLLLDLDVPVPLLNGGRCFRSDTPAPAGLTRRRIQALRAEGALREVVRGVYVDARAPDDPATWLDALGHAVPPGAVVARRSAAWVHGVDVRALSPPGAPPVVEVLADAGAPRRAGIHSHEAPPRAEVDELGGVRCTTPLRTAADLLRHLPRHMALSAADAMAHAGFFTADELIREVERHPAGIGLRRARRLASLCEQRSESFGESWTRLRIHDAGFPRPVAQIRIRDDRIDYRVDLGYPALRIGIEYDGLLHHSSPADRRRDELRRRRLRDEHGWTLLVVGRGEILGRSRAFELALGDLLGLEPRHGRRTW